METADPVEAMGSKEIAKRAAGGRDLSLIGTPVHLELLAQHAGRDPSPGVRLTAAAAAADILSRHRLGKAASKLDADTRSTVASWFRRIDPAHNPGVFSVFACLDCADGMAAIVGGLRDPRGDVRLGAGVGLMRLCTSLAVASDADLEARVVGLLSDRRHKVDAMAEIARVCVSAGFQSVATVLGQMNLPGAHGEIVRLSRTILDAFADPLTGLWFSDGRDAGETNPAPALPSGLVAFDDEGAVIHSGRGWKTRKRFPSKDGRRMYFRRVGSAEAAPAFQGDGRTWYGEVGPSMFDAVDAIAAGVDWETLPSAKASPDQQRLAAAGAACLPDTSRGHRTTGQLHRIALNLSGAVSALEAAIAVQKAAPDTWFLLAEALHASGQKSSAKSHYTKFLKKARKRDFPAEFERAKSRA